MAEMVRREALQVLKPKLGTAPRVYYKNYYRFSKSFLGGTVVATVNSQRECIADAKVTLYLGGKALADTVSDGFGDFKFDQLDTGSGLYRVEAIHPTLGKAERSVELVDSRYLDRLELKRP